MLGPPDLGPPAPLDEGVALGLLVHCHLALAGLFGGHERLSGPVGSGDLGGAHRRHPLVAGCPLDGQRRLLTLDRARWPASRSAQRAVAWRAAAWASPRSAMA